MERVGLCLWGDIWGSAYMVTLRGLVGAGVDYILLLLQFVEMCGVGVVGSWPQGQGLGPLRAEGVWGGGVEGT